MSERVIISCDICGDDFDPPPPYPGTGSRIGDCGVWIDGGTKGIPHICRPCQAVTTVERVRELLAMPPDGRRAAQEHFRKTRAQRGGGR